MIQMHSPTLNLVRESSLYSCQIRVISVNTVTAGTGSEVLKQPNYLKVSRRVSEILPCRTPQDESDK